MAQELHVQPAQKLVGDVLVDGDKSISHRAVMFASLASGASHIKGFLRGTDCVATTHVMQKLGVKIDWPYENELVVHGVGAHGLHAPTEVLDCDNSGTTIRLMAGILAGQSFTSILTGTDQIRRRPMGRVIQPLRQMGAVISAHQGNNLAPLQIGPNPKLHGISYQMDVASAQVKSCLLLAGLFADGDTTISEPGPARDHTERMLNAMGARIVTRGQTICVSPLTSSLKPLEITVPGDISSAAFLLVAAAIVPGSDVMIRHVGVNPTRTGIIDALRAMGAHIRVTNLHEIGGEPVADIHVLGSELHGATFAGDVVVRMIDELPVLAVAASHAKGLTTIRNAGELKVKETNRIDTTVRELRKMGATISATDDGFVVDGPGKLHGGTVDSHGDHRLAMAMAIAGLHAQGNTTVTHSEVVKDSFPSFVRVLSALGAAISSKEVRP